MQVSQEIATLLGKIAMDGLWAGNIRLSETIFNNIIPLREGNSGPILGLAMCYAHRGDHAKGIEIIEKQAFPAHEEDPHVQAWYGFMLCMNKNSSRGRAVLEKLLQNQEIPEDARHMAEAALQNIT